MISTKAKSPKPPVRKGATPRTNKTAMQLAAKQIAAHAATRTPPSTLLTDADRAEVVEVLLDQFPTLRTDCRAVTAAKAVQSVRNVLYARRVGPSFAYDQPGEVKLRAGAVGLAVERDSRRGILRWRELGRLVHEEVREA